MSSASFENKWSLNRKSCTIRSEYKDIKHILCLTLPASLYGSSSANFDHMIETPITPEMRKIYQVFLALAEKCKHAGVPPPPETRASRGGGSDDDDDESEVESDVAHLPDGDISDAEFEDVDLGDAESDSDSELNEEINIEEREEVNDGDSSNDDMDLEDRVNISPSPPLPVDDPSENQEEDNDDDLERVNISPRPETPGQEEDDEEDILYSDEENPEIVDSLRPGAPVDDPPPAPSPEDEHIPQGDYPVNMFLETVRSRKDRDKYLAYTFYIVIYKNSAAKPNELLSTIVEGNIKRMNTIRSNREAEGLREPWESWKTISSRREWERLFQIYTHSDNPQRKEDSVSMDLSNSMNPACALNFFSLPNAFIKRENDEIDTNQSLFASHSYSPTTKELIFPLRKYILHVLPSEISAKILYNRYLPGYQMRSLNQMGQIFSLILESDFKIREPQLLEAGWYTNMETLEPEERSAIERIEESPSETTMDDIFADENDVSVRSRKTKKEHVEAEFAKWGIKFYPVEGGANLDFSDVARQRAALNTSKKDNDKLLDKTCGGIYGSIRLAALKNLERIKTDYEDRANKEHWKDLKNPKLVARKLEILTKDATFDSYARVCRGQVEEYLSPVGRVIMQEIMEKNLYDNTFVQEKIDPSLDCFANSEVVRYEVFEHIYLIHNAHRIVSLAEKYALDAYVVDFTRAHLNMMTHSIKGSTSKSVAWLFLEQFFRISRTVMMLSYSSRSSRATEDANMNDNVVCYDEFPKKLIDQNDFGGSDEERMFKMLLTTNKVQVQVFDKDPDTGRRVTKTTYAEWIGVFFGSCNIKNLQTSIISHSMGRRWHIVSVSEVENGHRSLAETRLTELLKTVKEDASRAAYDKRFHLMQAVFFETSKLIYCQALTDVSLHTAAIVMLMVSAWLGQNGYPEPTTGQIDRIMMLARINCIRDAIERTWFNKGAPYEGKSIELDQFKYLDRLLFCSVRHIVRAIGEAPDVIVDPLEGDIRKAMGILHKQEAQRNVMQYDYRILEDYTIDENGVKKTKRVDNPSYLWFYLSGGGRKFHSLAHKIKIVMEAEKMDIVPSEDAIELRVRKWCDRNFEASDWVLEKLPNKHHQLTQVPDTKKVRRAAFTDEGSNSRRLLVHIEFIRNDSGKNRQFEKHIEVLKIALKYVLNRKYQIPRRLVFCQHPKVPKLLEIIDFEGETESSKLICLPQTNKMSEEDAKCLGEASKFCDSSRKKSYFTLMEDLDLYGLRKRNEELSITDIPVIPESLTENPLAIADDEEDEEYEEERRKAATMEGEEDEDVYDHTVGYFLGKSINKLFVSGGRRAASSLQKRHVQMIFQKLDQTPPRDCMRDRDFDPDLYLIKPAGDDGESVYHWSSMVDEVTLSQFRAGDYSAPYKVKRSDLDLIPLEEAMRIKATEKADCARSYKLIAPLPSLEEERLTEQHYQKTDDSEEVFRYPGKLASVVQGGRWSMWEIAETKLSQELGIEDALSRDPEITTISGAAFDGKKLVSNTSKVAQKHIGLLTAKKPVFDKAAVTMITKIVSSKKKKKIQKMKKKPMKRNRDETEEQIFDKQKAIAKKRLEGSNGGLFY